MPVYTNTFVTVDGMNISEAQAGELKKWVIDEFRYKPQNIKVGMSILVEGVEDVAAGFDLEHRIKKRLGSIRGDLRGKQPSLYLADERLKDLIDSSAKEIDPLDALVNKGQII